MSVVRRISGIGIAALAAVTLASSVMAAAAQDKKDKNQKPDPKAQAQAQAQQQEIQADVRLADAAMAGQAAPSEFSVQFYNDFIRAQGGRVWIPVILTLDPTKLTNPADQPVSFYVRIAPRGMSTPPAAQPAAANGDKDKKDKDKKKKDKNAAPDAKGIPSPYPFEDVSFLQLKPAAPGQAVRIQRGVSAPAGSYDLYIVIREVPAQAGAAPKVAVLKQPLDVPNYSTDFSTSSVILAEKVEDLSAPISTDQQAENPYTFGKTRFVVTPEHKFKKTDELLVLMQIYNPTLNDKKFDLEATYTFFTKNGPGETRFNSTAPQSLTPETMPNFDPTVMDRTLQAGQGIPLQSFPAGDYRLEVKITDKLSSKVLTQSVNFSVSS